MRCLVALLVLGGIPGALRFLPDDGPQKLKFTVEHLNLQTLKAGPLKPEEAKSFGAELKELEAVQDASCTETTGTLTLKPGATLKWTEIKATGKKTLSYDGGKPVIVLNTLKLQGSVTVTLHVEKNADKVPEALKSLGFKEVVADGDNYQGVVGTPVDLVTMLKVVAKKTGNDYKLEMFKDAAWHAPEAK
ncbi:MAG TPA: hypothetical protein VMU54_02840 [Planctomycetota bacterium]|nr:hypothetical protein [Planctomycetota bacterium]